jgi:hypothetical protein
VIKESTSPEGADWEFMYNGRLNRLYARRKGTVFEFTGDMSDDLLAPLREIFGGSTQAAPSRD